MSKSLGILLILLTSSQRTVPMLFRFTVLYLAPIGQDVLYSNEKCEMGRNFANKLWNAAVPDDEPSNDRCSAAEKTSMPVVSAQPLLDISDKWILSRYNSTIRDITESLENSASTKQ